MAILSDPPEWRVPGQKPPQNIIEVLGWEVASHPPAPWFNWFFHRVFESLLELESATLARIVNEAGVPSIMAGPESERPAASQETVGRIYIATDTKRMFRDRGNGWDLLNTPDAIGAETPGGAQQKADAAVAAHANRTDNPHQVTASQVGAPTQAAFDAHVTDTNNPHNVQAQQVPYSSGVAGFSPADVKAALDALAGVRIVEMGSNSNGTYVRWENGVQVCWFTNNPTPDFEARTEGAVSGYRHSDNWTYPAAFIANPSVVAIGRGVVGSQVQTSLNTSIANLSTTGAEISLWAWNQVNAGVAISRIAIGRWK